MHLSHTYRTLGVVNYHMLRNPSKVPKGMMMARQPSLYRLVPDKLNILMTTKAHRHDLCILDKVGL